MENEANCRIWWRSDGGRKDGQISIRLRLCRKITWWIPGISGIILHLHMISNRQWNIVSSDGQMMLMPSLCASSMCIYQIYHETNHIGTKPHVKHFLVYSLIAICFLLRYCYCCCCRSDINKHDCRWYISKCRCFSRFVNVMWHLASDRQNTANGKILQKPSYVLVVRHTKKLNRTKSSHLFYSTDRNTKHTTTTASLPDHGTVMMLLPLE